MPENAAALYRVSTLKQVKQEEDNIPLQQHVIREYIRKSNLHLVKEYEEPGISAFKLSYTQRDIILDVLRDAEAGAFSVLLVFKGDRLSRNLLEFPGVLLALARLGVKVIAVADGGRELKVENPVEVLMRVIEGFQAESESRNTSIRVSQAMMDMAKVGKWTGGRPPFGFCLSEKKNVSLEVASNEAEVLLEMELLYNQGMGSKLIAQDLNARGMRTREGCLWSDSRVRDALQNPIIAGLSVYGRTGPGKNPNSRVRKTDRYNLNNPNFIVPVDENGNYLINSEWEIIPLDRWLRLMAIMKSNRNSAIPDNRSIKSESLLTGFLKCGSCGRGFISSFSNRKTKNGITRRSDYRCVTKSRIGTQYCSGRYSYTQEKVDQAFMSQLEADLYSLDISSAAEHLKISTAKKQSSNVKALKALESKVSAQKRVLDGWIEKQNQLFRDPAQSLYSEEIIAEQVRKNEIEYKKLVSQLAEAKTAAQDYMIGQEKIRQFLSVASKWFEKFKMSPTEEKKRMLSAVLEKVVLDGNDMRIYYNVNFLEVAREAGMGSIEAQENVKFQAVVAL